MRLFGKIALAMFVVAIMAETVLSASIEPGFTQYLTTSTADTLIPVLIRPVGTLDPAALKRTVAAQFATRAERHRAVVTELRAVADATQPSILDELKSPAYQGRVEAVRSFWIDNAITANMTPTAIAEIANHPDVADVRYLPPVEFFSSGAPVDFQASINAPGEAQPGLRAIKADSLWKLGYTGKGRLVASLDTGVDGQHDFLKDTWRGNNGYSWQESWFYPLGSDTVPRYFPGDGDAHGTNVMGIMVAIQDSVLRDDPTLDTVGVAFDAQWITAAAIDIVGANIMEAMQWLADPDGNPNTEHDVPDAVANPWGSVNLFSGCSDVFWNGIDNVEAAGAAMIFAAGNEGNYGLYTIRNPGSRATTMTNVFAVGMVDARDSNTPIHPLSSRGPSDCGDSTAIKPNVVAPGVDIQTTRPRGFMTQGVLGTSFAVPHVAGGIALLREARPNATVDELKTALMLSATDLGAPGPDNTYGYGLINLVAALEMLPPNDQPALYINQDYYDRPSPGTSTEMIIVLRSQGTAVSNVMVAVTSEDSRLSVLDGTSPFGDILSTGDTSGNFADPFVFTVDASVLEGERLPIRFEITGNGGYTRILRGAIQVGPVRSQEVFTHSAGNFIMSVSSLGQFGLHPQGVAYRVGGQGYTYSGDATQSLFEGAFLVGNRPDHVSDNARDQGSFPDFDFQTDPGGRLDVTLGGVHAEETRAAFSDAYAEHPIGLFIEQRTFVDNTPEADDYLVVEYTIHNRSGAPAMHLNAGLFFDWDFPWLSGSGDYGGFDADYHLGWMSNVSSGSGRYRGLAVLTPRGARSYRHFLNDPEIYSPAGDDNGWDGFTDEEKWNAMVRGFEQTTHPSPRDESHLIATGPFDLDTNGSVMVAFAIIGGESVDDLRASAQHARAQYSGTCSCPNQADIDGNALIDNMDMLHMIDILFFNHPDPLDPLCPSTRSDLSNDGITDALDLQILIDNLYFEGEEPCDPCVPTGGACAGP